MEHRFWTLTTYSWEYLEFQIWLKIWEERFLAFPIPKLKREAASKQRWNGFPYKISEKNIIIKIKIEPLDFLFINFMLFSVFRHRDEIHRKILMGLC